MKSFWSHCSNHNPTWHLNKHFHGASGCNESTTLKIHTALFTETIKAFFRSQHKNMQILTKGYCIISYIRTYASWALSRQTLQDLGELITVTPQTVLKFRAAAAPFQLGAHAQIIRVHPTFYMPIFQIQHALSRSLIFDKFQFSSTPVHLSICLLGSRK